VAIKDFTVKTIDIADLLVNVQNPRFETQADQHDALEKMVNEQGLKLVRLAEHIGRSGGLNPSETPIVIKSKNSGKYTVLEGNRRVAAIKLTSEPKLVDSLNIPASIGKRLETVHSKHGKNLPLAILCTIAPSQKRAKPWIELRHTGENGGIGIISWNGVAAARYRGESAEIQLLEMVKDSVFLDNVTRDKLSKIALSNIDRLIKTPKVRRTLGIDIVGKQLVTLDSENKDEVLGRLAIVVSDVANKHIKVTQIDSKDQRVRYAEAVAARALPVPGRRIAPTDLKSHAQSERRQSAERRKRGVARARKTLIPKTLRLNIGQVRIAKIFDELQQLHVETFVNSCAVLLRVFLEMSLNEFAAVNRLSLTKVSRNRSGKTIDREMSLNEKVASVVTDLVRSDASCKKELHAIRTQAGTKDTIFSITNWQQYVHNQHYQPIASELKTIWDNIQPLFVKMWE